MLRVVQTALSKRPAGFWRWPIALAALLTGLSLEWGQGTDLPGSGVDRLISDQVLRWTASDAPEPRVTVVDIDEQSLKDSGPWPWPRERIASLVEHLLSDYSARAVALDFVLPEPGTAPDHGDQRLAALGEHAPVVFSQAFDYLQRVPALRVGVLARGERHGSSDISGQTVKATGFIANFNELRNARHIGNIGLLPDHDGAIRRLPLLTEFEQNRYLPLSFELLRSAGIALPSTRSDDGGFWAIPYKRVWPAYTVVSASSVLRREVPLGAITGRLVIIGSSSFGLADRVATPLDKSTAGVMVHAAAASALLDMEPRPAVWSIDARWIASAWIAAMSIFAILALPLLPAFWSISVLSLFTLAWMTTVFVFIPAESVYSPAAPLATVLLLVALAIPYEWRLSQIESKRILNTFRHYVAQSVLDQLLSQRGLQALDPKLLQVTTLVADMEGYSNLVEHAPLNEAVALTREFLDCITRPVLEQEGTLDKYIGDGLMCFWGAPLPSKDHADRALDAASAMLHAVNAFNELRRSLGKSAIRVRIGVETGLAVAGDLGTPFRSVYTAVGDSVNMAARLQELGRSLPHDVVIGPGTANAVSRHELLALGPMAIRGRKSQLEIFTIRGGI